jgi:adenine C2-methylase RlmN of 23S rRNA A2503 and tRNA A37
MGHGKKKRTIERISIFEREKVLQFLYRGPHGKTLSTDEEEVLEAEEEAEEDGTNEKLEEDRRQSERSRRNAERFYQVILQHAQRKCSEILFNASDENCDTRQLDFLQEIQEIPQWARNRIPERFDLLTTRVAMKEESKDQSTTKMIVELQDGHKVEAVVIRHLKGRRAEGRKGGAVTLCISSQVGCKMGCTFCATGTMGELGNLSSGEIVEQVMHARALEPRVRNIVFMGMGEPLNNYDAVVDAIRCISQNENQKGFNIPCPKICVSTVGVIPNIYRFQKDCPTVSMALSLHAPTQEIRKRIVPTATAYPLNELMKCLDDYLAKSERQSMLIEYCVLKGINDTVECAHLLGELLRGKKVVLNFIPYNPTDVIAGHERPDIEDIYAMNKILREEYDLTTTVRHEMGSDIAGACGQLTLSLNGKKIDKMMEIKDIEEMLGVDIHSSQSSSLTKKKNIVGRILKEKDDEKVKKSSSSLLKIAPPPPKKTSTTAASKNTIVSSYSLFNDWTKLEIAMLGVATACSLALICTARFSKRENSI